MNRLPTALLVIAWLLPASTGSAAEDAPPPPTGEERPEYRTRTLPTDTFKPSEQVSEDYAVPFPADI
jgi:hypothetical protein